jgi:endo-1,4-beta-xylanase
MIRNLLFLLPALAWGQTPISLINGDPLACFTMSGASASNLSTVPVTGMPFNRAMRVRTGEVSASANPWDIRPRCFNTLAASQDDTVVAVFWMRTLSSPEGRGYTTFVAEMSASPYTKPVQYSTMALAEWKKVEIPFTMPANYVAGGQGANGYNLSFWVVFPNQEIEIGGLTVMDFGPNVPYSSLGLTTWPYQGHALDASWRKAADERIDRYRKTDIVVVARDDAGRPLPGARVRVKMKRHAFGFGTAVADGPIRANTADGQRYREELSRLFNKMVFENTLKWPFWEQSWGRTGAEAIFSWLPSSGITMTRGHNVIWPGKGNLPADVVALLNATPVDKDKLRARIDAHIREVMTYTKGRLTEWDVLNEPYTNKDVQAVLGDQEMARWFQIARETDPAVKLYINDYDITEGGGFSFQHMDAYERIIRLILSNGGPIDGIGLQSHLGANLTPPDRVYEILDRFAGLGKDLQVTEFDVNIKDEQIQADYTRDYLTVCFSHPAMKGFMLWGFWAGAHWLPDGAMFRKDWSTRPMYDVWKDLIYGKWWTDVEGTAGPDGIFRTRGFLGDYDVEVNAGGAAKTVPLTVPSSELPAYAPTGPVTPGALKMEGVVNGASFAGGPLAPGELVTLFGEGFGPAEPAPARYRDDRLMTSTGDTRVLFDGIPAPMIHSLRGQVSAIVPASVSGRTKIEVEYLGTRTNAVEIAVAAAAPGIFATDGGKTAVAFTVLPSSPPQLNKDLPAPQGSYLVFFVTGEGALTPGPYPAPAQELKVYIGGVESNCANNWKGQIYPGVMQVNACVPDGATAGAVPIQVTVGGVPSPAGPVVQLR